MYLCLYLVADGVTKGCELKCRNHPAKFNPLPSANIWTLLHFLRTHLLLAVCYDFSPYSFDETSISFSLFFHFTSSFLVVAKSATFTFVIGVYVVAQ